MAIPKETFFLMPNAEGTLQNQIQQLVAEAILSGRFRPNEKMPSSRKLAKHLSVSRITVTLAYTELLADDYLTSRGRSGYYISENAPQPPKFPIKPVSMMPDKGTAKFEKKTGMDRINIFFFELVAE